MTEYFTFQWHITDSYGQRCRHCYIFSEDNDILLCWSKFKQYKDYDTTFNLKDHLWTLYLHEKGLFTIPKGLDGDTIYDGCNCGNRHLTILPTGDVYACRRMESAVGNARADSLYSIFHGRQMAAYREHHGFEKCSACELLRFCRGCSAVTYGYTHNFYSADPSAGKPLSDLRNKA